MKIKIHVLVTTVTLTVVHCLLRRRRRHHRHRHSSRRGSDHKVAMYPKYADGKLWGLVSLESWILASWHYSCVPAAQQRLHHELVFLLSRIYFFCSDFEYIVADSITIRITGIFRPFVGPSVGPWWSSWKVWKRAFGMILGTTNMFVCEEWGRGCGMGLYTPAHPSATIL